MELKLTTRRALEFEERTGKDLVELLEEITKTQKFKIRDLVDLFIACGDNYTAEMFDEWDAPLYDKVEAITNALSYYFAGDKVAPKKSGKGKAGK